MKDIDSENTCILCPSAECRDGAILLGIVQSNGVISFLENEKKVVNEEFIQIAKKGRIPEKRFRFAYPCMKSQCKQWMENKCTVIEKAMQVVNSNYLTNILPECSIRSQCRWYEQCGRSACSICPHVITDMED